MIARIAGSIELHLVLARARLGGDRRVLRDRDRGRAVLVHLRPLLRRRPGGNGPLGTSERLDLETGLCPALARLSAAVESAQFVVDRAHVRFRAELGTSRERIGRSIWIASKGQMRLQWKEEKVEGTYSFAFLRPGFDGAAPVILERLIPGLGPGTPPLRFVPGVRVPVAATSGCGDGSEPVGVATAVTGSARADLVILARISTGTLSLTIREDFSAFGFGPGFLRWRPEAVGCAGAAMVLEEGEGEREPVDEEDVVVLAMAIVVEEDFVMTIVLCMRMCLVVVVDDGSSRSEEGFCCEVEWLFALLVTLLDFGLGGWCCEGLEADCVDPRSICTRRGV